MSGDMIEENLSQNQFHAWFKQRRRDEIYRLFVMLAAGILMGIAIGQHLLPICE